MLVSNKILAVVTFLYLFLFFAHLVYFATKQERVLTVRLGSALRHLRAPHGRARCSMG